MSKRTCSAIVIGASAGGREALKSILSLLGASFPLPILAVQHLHASDRGAFARHMNGETELKVRIACDKERIKPGHVYFAPANYHLLVEEDKTLALSLGAPVHWSRPSIDVLFKSAARVWGEQLIGVVLTGNNRDGASGLQTISACGGVTVVQDPDSAQGPTMPQAALEAGSVDKVLSLSEIGVFLLALSPHDKLQPGKSSFSVKENLL